MNKRLKVILLIIIGVLGIACTAAGCRIGPPSREETLRGYNVRVTYYGNGGNFDDNESRVMFDLYQKNDPESENYSADGIPFYDITEEKPLSGTKVLRSGYDLVGWALPERYTDGEHSGEIKYLYIDIPDGSGKVVTDTPIYPLYETDENGQKKLDGDGNPIPLKNDKDRPLFAREGVDEQLEEKNVYLVATDTMIDSSYKVRDDEHLIVCAVWKPTLKFVYKLWIAEEFKIGGEYPTYHDAAGNEYTYGSVLRSDAFGKTNSASPNTLAPIGLTDATFYKSYTDEECQNPANGSIARPDGDEAEDIVIWSSYIDGGGWTIIDGEAADVRKMFSNLHNASNKYYFMSDVNMEGVTLPLRMLNCAATIQGNGHVIYNLSFEQTQEHLSGSVNNYYSIFGNITASAKISDLTIRGNADGVIPVAITAGIKNVSYFAIIGRCSDQADISGLVIDAKIDATIRIDETRARVDNAQNGDRTHWLFGEGDSDEQFVEAFAGKITVNYPLTDNVLTLIG